jgi:hypothetical protein
MLVVYSVPSATKQKMQLIVLGDNEHILEFFCQESSQIIKAN